MEGGCDAETIDTALAIFELGTVTLPAVFLWYVASYILVYAP